jgi:D-mannonate dehydratase
MPFNCFLDYFITQPEELVDQELTKLKPLNYNKFMWWRTHAQKGVSLGKRAPLFDRINNGDFDFSCYYWQAQSAAIQARKKLDLDVDDYQSQYEKTMVDVARYRRLLADYHKEEAERIKELIDAFTQSFVIDREHLIDSLSNWSNDLTSFYEFINEFYLAKPAELRKRGRPSKS